MAEKSSSFCELLGQFLSGVGKKELSKSRKPRKCMLIWHQAKVETLTFPCETLRDALGKHVKGVGRLGLQLTAANKAGWPYTHVLVVDSFVPDIGSPTVTAVRETVKEIISPRYNATPNVLCCVCFRTKRLP